MQKRLWQTAVLTALTLSVSTSVPFAALAENPASLTADAKTTDLNAAFAQAAAEFGVPQSLLMAISYSETRWQEHGDEPSKNNGFGLMHLVDNHKQKGLETAAKGLGLSKNDLKKSPLHNIRGGAYLLAKHQQELHKPLSDDVADWYEATARYFDSKDKAATVLFADAVYAILKNGAALTTPEGQTLEVAPTAALVPLKGEYAGVSSDVSIQSADYGPALWNPAYSGNYAVASRPTSNPITSVIIHDIEGSYASAINWFKDPAAGVSAHYVIRSSDGQITQMVAEKDIAWHARSYNSTSIGIEHEGYANQTGWYTDSMYRASAALVRNIGQKYGIPLTRDNILAHSELWGNTHTDPGKYWDWNYYMQLVNQNMTKNYAVVNMDDSNFENGSFTKYGPAEYWRPITGYGIHNQMTYTNGNMYTIANYGIYKPNIPTAGSYEIKVFIPSNYAGTAGARYVITHAGGTTTKVIAQKDYSNEWVSLGTYTFAAGTAGQVKLGDDTGDKASIAFDGIRFIAR
ncbi:N-acetylmuramoyl-L-alanine amidase [Tumebacillus sp. DT12]|uniref:N-acetylmuramoyl-L-alanine amidase n=1 Tax=Tumebacillus lacus TaxID=2995335 RepID=A0ABT3X1Z8_9BACL|nr:N-acetylmuramoyl-L-alanine amidase [Tumebacillus lacus]MCX7569812.1 N-acetylmuramoyl-L-alanine amidase [Tumebacillus lacus]